MNKRTREIVYNKYNGRCAYCGDKIEIKDMQVDHVVPKRLGGLDEVTNYNPSCRLCNHYKRATELEVWRKYFLGEIVKRLRKFYIFKVAEKYGMIEVREWDGKFYFEKEPSTENGVDITKEYAEKQIKEYKEFLDNEYSLVR